MLIALLLNPAMAWLGNDLTYNYSQSGTSDADAPVYSFVDISADPNAVMLSISSSDDSTQTLGVLNSTLPVPFYGIDWDVADINVTTNGVITFEAGAGFSSYCCSGNPIPTSSPDLPAIFAFWTDLNPSSGGDIWALDDGNTLYIQYSGVPFYSSTGSNTVQVSINRSLGDVIIKVDDQQGSDDVAIGIQSGSGGGGQGIEAYEGFTPMTGVTTPVMWLFRPTLIDDIDDDGDGYAGVEDCNDANPDINPDAIEVCDFVDNDCNGQIDEAGGTQTFYEDADGDGWGDENAGSVTNGSCEAPEGYGPPGDCNDNDTTVRPGVTERCDPVDHNCDGDLYAGATDLNPYQVDADGDGWGVAPTHFVCELPADAATEGTGDCDDTDAAIYPGANETPFDGIDNNCDGRELDDRDHDGMSDADEYAFGSDWRHPDTDGDGIQDGAEFDAGGDPTVTDSDGDGISDYDEMAGGPIDTDGDGIANIADPDDDGDGHFTVAEGNVDTDNDGTPDYLDTDSDDDGIPDAEETPENRIVFNEGGSEADEDDEKGCGCSASAGGSVGWLVLPLALVGLRRRS